MSLPTRATTDRRAAIVVLDGVGAGEAPDAAAYGDVGSDTLANTSRAVGGFDLPALESLGLGRIKPIDGLSASREPAGAWGIMEPRSAGKDSTTGHWEIAGLHLARPFPTYPHGFPRDLIDEFAQRTGRSVIGNGVGSGTAIIDTFGAEHMRCGAWIVYTSADSVFQIAAHEAVVPLDELYAACDVARMLLVEPHNVSRVIARPFVGEVGSFKRTYNRRDYSMPPPRDTVLDRVKSAGLPVVGVGKIEDIFAARGVTESVHTEGNRDGMRATIDVASKLEKGFVFVNLVDFDMLYGHRRDARGYRRALEEFDRDYVELEKQLRDDDLVLISADHGNDPTKHETTDHTREYVPILAAGKRVKSGVNLGTRESFADIGATVEEALGLAPVGPGRSFLSQISRG